MVCDVAAYSAPRLMEAAGSHGHSLMTRGPWHVCDDPCEMTYLHPKFELKIDHREYVGLFTSGCWVLMSCTRTLKIRGGLMSCSDC
jgi:hypothetical protein